ncbi:MAG: hypothetical protein IT303_19375 [Dehalococcoidia bacterium]|nr:hypothetical protein [Dehalococcoidia bacterium]
MMHRPHPRLMTLAAGLTIASLLLSACGGGDGGGKKVDPDDWVADLCDLWVDSDDELNSIGEDIDTTDKDSVLDVLDDAVNLSGNLRDDFDDLGQPDIEDGDKVREAFQASLEHREEAFAEARDKVNDLDEDDDDFEDQVFEVFEEMPQSDLLDDLEELADNNDDVADLVDEINAECGDIIFASVVTGSTPAGVRA